MIRLRKYLKEQELKKYGIKIKKCMKMFVFFPKIGFSIFRWGKYYFCLKEDIPIILNCLHTIPTDFTRRWKKNLKRLTSRKSNIMIYWKISIYLMQKAGMM